MELNGTIVSTSNRIALVIVNAGPNKKEKKNQVSFGLDHLAGKLKELGRVDELLRVEDETQIRCSHLSEGAIDEIKQVIAKHEGELKDVSNPQSTLEQLFLEIVRQSEERPGMRAGSK